MEIKLFRTSSPMKQVTKQLSNLLTLEGDLRDECEVVSPTVVVEGDATIMSYNYAYIPAFGRYYYCKPKALRTNVFQLTLTVDCLMSFDSGIRGNSAIIDKVQNAGVAYNYINDGSFVVTNRTNNTIVNFPSGFNEGGEFILITAGGME